MKPRVPKWHRYDRDAVVPPQIVIEGEAVTLLKFNIDILCVLMHFDMFKIAYSALIV